MVWRFEYHWDRGWRSVCRSFLRRALLHHRNPLHEPLYHNVFSKNALLLMFTRKMFCYSKTGFPSLEIPVNGRIHCDVRLQGCLEQRHDSIRLDVFQRYFFKSMAIRGTKPDWETVERVQFFENSRVGRRTLVLQLAEEWRHYRKLDGHRYGEECSWQRLGAAYYYFRTHFRISRRKTWKPKGVDTAVKQVSHHR